MYRVVIKRRDHRDQWIIEHGPWLSQEDDAEGWAHVFRGLGYVVRVENMHGELSQRSLHQSSDE